MLTIRTLYTLKNFKNIQKRRKAEQKSCEMQDVCPELHKTG